MLLALSWRRIITLESEKNGRYGRREGYVRSSNELLKKPSFSPLRPRLSLPQEHMIMGQIFVSPSSFLILSSSSDNLADRRQGNIYMPRCSYSQQLSLALSSAPLLLLPGSRPQCITILMHVSLPPRPSPLSITFVDCAENTLLQPTAP